jgi:hypothetical protein
MLWTFLYNIFFYILTIIILHFFTFHNNYQRKMLWTFIYNIFGLLLLLLSLFYISYYINIILLTFLSRICNIYQREMHALEIWSTGN